MKIRLCELREGHDNYFGECGDHELTGASWLTRSAPSPGCAPDSHDTRAALRASSRLTVLGICSTTDAIVRSEWPWAGPGSWVLVLPHSSVYSRSLAGQHRSPSAPAVLHVE